MVRRKHIDISLSADACIFGALMLLLLPMKWLLSAVAAAAFHEWCHYFVLRLSGVEIHGFSISSVGAVMETQPMDDGQELFCALAGPMGSLLLLALIRWLPELAICAGIQGIFNLLPIFPLDGGRAVRSLLGVLFPEVRDKLFHRIQWGMISVIFIAALACFFYFRMGCGVLLGVIFLIRRALARKIPCKDGHKGVQ